MKAPLSCGNARYCDTNPNVTASDVLCTAYDEEELTAFVVLAAVSISCALNDVPEWLADVANA